MKVNNVDGLFGKGTGKEMDWKWKARENRQQK